MWLAMKENIPEGGFCFVPRNNVLALSTLDDIWGLTIVAPASEGKEEHLNVSQLAFVSEPWEIRTAHWFKVVDGLPVLVSDPKVS